jgi:hypothetical protein
MAVSGLILARFTVANPMELTALNGGFANTWKAKIDS